MRYSKRPSDSYYKIEDWVTAEDFETESGYSIGRGLKHVDRSLKCVKETLATTYYAWHMI